MRNTTLGPIEFRSLQERVIAQRRRALPPVPPVPQRLSGPTLPPPGWLVDDHNPRLVRWWDGRGWTVHTRRVPWSPRTIRSVLCRTRHKPAHLDRARDRRSCTTPDQHRAEVPGDSLVLQR